MLTVHEILNRKILGAFHITYEWKNAYRNIILLLTGISLK